MNATCKSHLRQILSATCAVLLSWSAISLTMMPAHALDGASESDEKPPIKIGFLCSLTGTGSISSDEMVRGIKLYLEEIKSKMAGRNVQLLIEDDESSPLKGAVKLKKLIEKDKIDVLAGFFFSPMVYAAAPMVEKYQIPTICSVAGADDITQRQHKKWIVRVSRSSSQGSHAMGDYAATTLGFKKVVTIGSDYSFGYETVGGFQSTFERAGGQVIQKLWVPLDAKDFSGVMKEIRKDADAVYLCAPGVSAEIIPKQYNEFGPKLPLLGADSSFEDHFLPTIGGDLIGGMCSSPYVSTINNTANQHFVKLYRAKYHSTPGLYSEFSYTTGKLIAQAVDAVKGKVEDKEKFMAALQKGELNDDPRGPMKLDQYGNPVQNIYICKLEKVKDGYQNKIIHTYNAVSQFWKSKPEDYLAKPLFSKYNPGCPHCMQGK